MSEPASALTGSKASGLVDIADAGPVGMVTIRGDLTDGAVRKAVSGTVGCDVPEVRRFTSTGSDKLLWMSPDELMLVCPHGEAEARCTALSKALDGLHHLVIDVSDARTVLTLRGGGAMLRDVLAKLTPADLRAAAQPLGEVRRTRLAQVSGAFWFETETQATIICFRSVASYVFELLRHAAESGSEVGYFG